MDGWNTENGIFDWYSDGKKIVSCHGQAFHQDGRMLDTRTARQKACTTCRIQDDLGTGVCIGITFEGDDGLSYQQKLFSYENGMAAVQGILSEQGRTVAAKRILPAVTEAPTPEEPDIFRSLWTKMLLVPYDNTMWVRYEAVPLRPGRMSYDLTAVYSEKTGEGMLIGAADFDLWKNGIRCSGSEARVLECISGVADAGTHDSCSHGTVRASEAASARFLFMYGQDYRRLLEQYGEIIKKKHTPLKWGKGVPFGWNSWSGLAMKVNEKNYKEAGEFLGEILQERSFQNNGTTYVNFDAGWNRIPDKTLKELSRYFHEKGQKTGIYLAPFAWFGKEETLDQNIPDIPEHRVREMLLKDEAGNILPRVDGGIPMDVTHPLWKCYMEKQLERFADNGFDYLKMDFLSHGGMEGKHYDRTCQTGRQALEEGYRFLTEHLSEQNMGRPFFLSLSIAPLFPSGMGHARRFSCDAFGTVEDTEYVLNALTYAWWQNGTLYQYNDPDHISLYRSFCTGRVTEFGEAKARYTAAAISGTVMMLSEDFGETGKPLNEEQTEARRRAEILCTNGEINRLAASGISFCPVFSAGTGASRWYSACIEGRQYLAVFHLNFETETLELDLKKEGFTGKKAVELWTGHTYLIDDESLIWKAEGPDAAVFVLDDRED